MKIAYPNKMFAGEVKAALDFRHVVEVTIASGWRSRMLAKEVKCWATTKASTCENGGPAKSPSFMFNLLNFQLVAFHWFALSAGYKMESLLLDNQVVLKYAPA